MGSARRPRGLTLVEVVAALALMAGVLTTALVTRARLAEQAQRAELRQEAVELLITLNQEARTPLGVGSFTTGRFYVEVDERAPASLDALGLNVRRTSVYPADDREALALASVERFVPRPEALALVVEGGAR